LYIDIARTVKSQKEQLIGQFQSLFGQKVYDHKAAVELLIEKLRIIESEFNQNSNPTLLNYKKRIDSDEINATYQLITNKRKAFDLWRSEKKSLSKLFNITIADQSAFKLDFINSFDLFKDLKQFEHQKILSFVFSRKDILSKFHSDLECIEKLNTEFRLNHSSPLNEKQVKAAIFAGYLELKDLL